MSNKGELLLNRSLLIKHKEKLVLELEQTVNLLKDVERQLQQLAAKPKINPVNPDPRLEAKSTPSTSQKSGRSRSKSSVRKSSSRSGKSNHASSSNLKRSESESSTAVNRLVWRPWMPRTDGKRSSRGEAASPAKLQRKQGERRSRQHIQYQYQSSSPQLALPPETDEEEMLSQAQKRSKLAKLDTLFCSEDVDLRHENPAVKPGVIIVEDGSMDRSN